MQVKYLCISVFLYVFSLSVYSLTVEKTFYEEHSDPLEQFQTTLQQAKKNNTLILMVIGANWCHDSRALAEQLNSDAVKEVINQHYSLMLVNAGWLTDLSTLLGPLGHPVYFGTPSVFIIDPVHEIILNRPSVQRWQSAHSESDSSLAHYLTLQNEKASERTKLVLTRKSENSQRIAQVLAFEEQQAKRLYHAYSILGPKLAIESQTGHAQELDHLWEEVRKYRYKLQRDLVVLYQSMDNEELYIPEYQRLSFE
ncbi:thioredoxin family protein [Alteromonas ponticola]|uniref:Thioredoxin family protein n=1 Tax=Alteromonas aquimaris TaxID=2998417 RepID=A0ABT3P620_9ALTE|nr:thioredoxin family protein [Alteromonas aquimaris]MCW8108209.1 thioredoxin family protein [Alteromonas aquimaris]